MSEYPFGSDGWLSDILSEDRKQQEELPKWARRGGAMSDKWKMPSDEEIELWFSDNTSFMGEEIGWAVRDFVDSVRALVEPTIRALEARIEELEADRAGLLSSVNGLDANLAAARARIENLTVDRDDRCASCGGSMLYRVDKLERVVSRFCADDDCPLFLREDTERGEEER